ncbi:MAG: S41 family peptidase [Acidobacteriota bacterium]
MGRQRIVVVGLSFLVLAFTLAGRLVGGEGGQRDQTYQDLATFTEVLDLVNSSYVDPVAEDLLMSGAFRGMLASLDPKSGWLSPEEVKALSDDDNRLASGIEMTKRSGYAYVAAVQAGSPAAVAGVHPGEYIRTINGRSTREMSVFQIRHALGGPAGTNLSLNLFGGREGRTIAVDLVPYESAPVSVEERDGGVLLIRVHYLEPETVEAVKLTLAQPSAATRHVLLDLRDTVGGDRETGVGLADLFLAGGPIVEVTRRGAEPVTVAAGTDTSWSGPLSVLVNRMSAGTVEIAVAALKGRERAEILGEPTFGDDTVQRLIRLPDDSALILSVGHYVGPDGSTWSDGGIEPDVAIIAGTAATGEAAGEDAGENAGDEDDDQLARALAHIVESESAEKSAA